MNVMLMRELTMEEVKLGLDNIGNLKAPGAHLFSTRSFGILLLGER
jgi:hypothetical protein